MRQEKTKCDVPAIWQEHKSELRSFILKRVKDNELTNDILQDVLIKVYNFCLSKSGIKNVRSWLFQIAQNIIIDNYRRKSISNTSSVFPDMVIEDENLAFKEAANYITPLLNFLPEKYAIPLKLSDLKGLKQKDIAVKLNLSVSATKSRIQRARQLLKEEFISCIKFEIDSSGSILSFQIKEDCKPLQEIKNKIIR